MLIRRYPTKYAAELITQQANKFITGATFTISHNPVEESDKKRGVGDWAVSFQRNSHQEVAYPTIDNTNASNILDKAEARALAIELAAYHPEHPLLKTWWLNPKNTPTKHEFNKWTETANTATNQSTQND